jgi:histidinol-phosphatase (PHP family)
MPADSHVHSEWSWDTGVGSMRETCRRALQIGLPAVVFTEHFDFEKTWHASRDKFPEETWQFINGAGYLVPPPLEVDGYFATIDRCRHEFPALRILTGVEWGQPHLTEHQARELVDFDRFDRINGSLHTLVDGRARAEPFTLYNSRPAADVMEAYFAEVPAMVAGSDVFEVFTHLDYAVRGWPSATAGPFDPLRFEDSIRQAMRAIAASGRALEMNTRRLELWMPLWWRQEGGRAITFGSDAHLPEALAAGFPEAMLLVEHVGFGPGARAEDFWTC